MKRKEFTVIHVINAVAALNRAGHTAGQSSVAKLSGITPGRAKGVLSSALKLGLLYAYSDRYRKNVNRICYALTDTGFLVARTVSEHKSSTIWALTDEE